MNRMLGCLPLKTITYHFSAKKKQINIHESLLKGPTINNKGIKLKGFDIQISNKT